VSITYVVIIGTVIVLAHVYGCMLDVYVCVNVCVSVYPLYIHDCVHATCTRSTAYHYHMHKNFQGTVDDQNFYGFIFKDHYSYQPLCSTCTEKKYKDLIVVDGKLPVKPASLDNLCMYSIRLNLKLMLLCLHITGMLRLMYTMLTLRRFGVMNQACTRCAFHHTIRESVVLGGHLFSLSACACV